MKIDDSTDTATKKANRLYKDIGCDFGIISSTAAKIMYQNGLLKNGVPEWTKIVDWMYDNQKLIKDEINVMCQ